MNTKADSMPSTTAVRAFAMPTPWDESGAPPATSQAAHDGSRSLEGAKKAADEFAHEKRDPLGSDIPPNRSGITFAAQDKLPKLPIPDLEGTASKYLAAVKPLQSAREHAETQQAVEEFLKAEGPELQERLKKYANGKTSYIEQFCGYGASS